MLIGHVGYTTGAVVSLTRPYICLFFRIIREVGSQPSTYQLVIIPLQWNAFSYSLWSIHMTVRLQFQVNNCTLHCSLLQGQGLLHSRLLVKFIARLKYTLFVQEEGWKLNRNNYYQEGWLATGNVRGVVGVTFTSSHARRPHELPLRTNYNLRGHRSDVSSPFAFFILIYIVSYFLDTNNAAGLIRWDEVLCSWFNLVFFLFTKWRFLIRPILIPTLQHFFTKAALENFIDFLFRSGFNIILSESIHWPKKILNPFGVPAKTKSTLRFNGKTHGKFKFNFKSRSR